MSDLESKLIYAVVVAGKSATFADAVMERLARYATAGESLFDMLKRHIAASRLDETLYECRTGNYRKLEKCIRALVRSDFNLGAVTPQQLETIHGIGPKTARFFVLWTRPNANFAALDVHVLRWMRKQGHDTPDATPTGKRYAELEKAFLVEAAKRGKTPRELDFEIWNAGSRYDPAL